jgi:hypothetical protein
MSVDSPWNWRRGALFLALLLSCSLSFGQTVSQKQDVAVFRLGHYRWDIPDNVLGSIDEEIRGVFVNLGRFNVITLTQRLEQSDLHEFIERLKEYREQRVEIPQQVQMGREFFTQADFDRLVGSFIVVVPTVSHYQLVEDTDGDYRATIRTSFTFIDVQESSTMAQAFVETEGTDAVSDQAVKEALDGIAMRLTFELRKIAAFQIRTGILEVRGSEVILELGRDMGIVPGDEYLILASRVLDSGKTFTTENGLLVIKEVSEEVSVGQLIYARPKPQVGDQLRELPRLGLDTTPYLHAARGLLYDRTSTVLAGARLGISRGFYDFRPFLGVEIPFIANIAAALPLNLYIGGEYNLYLGRLQFVPMAAFGVGGAYLWYLEYVDIPEEKRFVLTHVGGLAGLAVNYLLNKNLRLSLEGGYANWFTLVPGQNFLGAVGELFFPSYDGLFVGAGILIRF